MALTDYVNPLDYESLPVFAPFNKHKISITLQPENNEEVSTVNESSLSGEEDGNDYSE